MNYNIEDAILGRVCILNTYKTNKQLQHFITLYNLKNTYIAILFGNPKYIWVDGGSLNNSDEPPTINIPIVDFKDIIRNTFEL